jgi:integrase
MLKTNSAPKHPQYTFKKGNVYYYSRIVPKDIRCYYSAPRIVTSLKTKSLSEARMVSQVYSAKLEQYWLSLRLQNLEVPALNIVNSKGVEFTSNLPTILEAKDLYFEVKGKGRPKLFFDTATRNVKYLIECIGNKPIDVYSSKDAATFREWLLDKGLSISSLRRIFSGVKAVVNFAILECGLGCDNAFARVYIPSNTTAKKRHPISQSSLLKIQNQCKLIDDDIRWLVALISDTGMRLSEALGLMMSDIDLNSEIPLVRVKVHKHRRLKTAASEREIPLIGLSLWAARRLIETTGGDFCFPRYTDSSGCKANSASAAVNKWLKSVGDKSDVIHGFRHNWRDRLRMVEAPSEMIDSLGGWSLKSVGESYGDGYHLSLMYQYLSKIELKQLAPSKPVKGI